MKKEPRRPHSTEEAARDLRDHLERLKERELLDLVAERLREDSRERRGGVQWTSDEHRS
jgi:hypothetical protein